MKTLTDFLSLLIEHLLRHLLPGEAQVSRHRDHAQPYRAARRKINIHTEVGSEGVRNRLVREIARCDDVGQRHAGGSADAPALCEVHLDKGAMLAAKLGERIQCLYYACTLGP